MEQFSLKIKLWVKAFLPAIVWAMVIFTLSSQPTLPGFESGFFDFILKKSAHMFVYAVLYLLIARGVEMVEPTRAKKSWLVFLPLLIVLFYAISDEFHQSLVPNRYPTFRDIGYDILGASLMFFRKYKYI
ncbi:VanZ family protein [Patescibacteria group bacterium]|nr:VanZ family protein [Patescibacteria group bacterium]